MRAKVSFRKPVIGSMRGEYESQDIKVLQKIFMIRDRFASSLISNLESPDEKYEVKHIFILIGVLGVLFSSTIISIVVSKTLPPDGESTDVYKLPIPEKLYILFNWASQVFKG